MKFSFLVFKFPDQLPGLLWRPRSSWVGRDSRNVNTACVQFNEEEHIQCPQPDGFYCEEVCGQKLFFVMCHQMSPTDRAATNQSWQDSVLLKYVPDACARYSETQLEHFPFDLAISPAWILLCQAQNQTFKFLINKRSLY